MRTAAPLNPCQAVCVLFAGAGLLAPSAVRAEEAAKPDPQVVPVSATTPAALPRSDHPLIPVLNLAREGHNRLGSEIRDYTCRIVRRERRDGVMRSYEFISAKIRHEQEIAGEKKPFSVYLHFDRPTAVAGREVLYLEGRNLGRMLVRRGGRRLSYVTTFLAPDSPMALKESRYPVTDIGFRRMIGRLIEVIQEDLKHEECRVAFFKNAKIGDRSCTRIVVEHPIRRDHFRYHRAIVFIDDERQIPLGYASYTWPETPGDKPILMEEYIYANVKLNVGLTDADFERSNPTYGFLKRDQVVAQD